MQYVGICSLVICYLLGGIMSGRVSKLERLLETEQGKNDYREMLLAIESRASLVAASGMIGIHPNTLTKWIAKGKEDSEGIYKQFYDDVILAISKAVTSAEIEVNIQSPKFYLQRGFARVLLGDVYNIDSLPLEATYNLDGTVGDGDDLQRNQTMHPSIETNNEMQPKAIDEMTINALIELRNNGIDLNSLVDNVQSENRHIESEDNQ
jgi:hypothetical protein